MMFADRKEAGRRLARKIEAYRGTNALVLALPRGGVVVGFEVARALGLPLDILAPRKIGHPFHPEYAIGAVDEHGTKILNEAEAAAVDQAWLLGETERQKAEAERRIRAYRGERKAAEIGGKTVIIVDDGIATGLTMRLAVRSVKARKPERIVVAVPVAPPESPRALTDEGADEVVVLEPPGEFMGAVGAHYARFEQVEDAEVVRLLHSS
ncbi:hypothetical protein A2766_01520 [Candidatus Kaiserbacteria bacterium RIFCSPHIGHO2_01_FULL_58_22]|nr:MAG: hypothetical protein A2766_01520 [Candidatus Kaiserbacteria bacterium RIFCSPHIGHO2_01_FULL_58_22]